MKTVGIVAEYNPFHKGHEYQLKTARELSGCEAVAVVMSGNFVQRGEPAIIDKYKRAEAAVYGGSDLVIELPMPFSCQNAEMFARAAILELKKLNISHLSFGCENDDINLLKKIAYNQVFDENFSKTVKKELKKGISYPSALTNAMSCIFDDDISEVLKSPNNVLGIEYIKSSFKCGCDFEFVPIKRIGKNHNDKTVSGVYDSATAIRKSIIGDFKNLYNLSLTEKSIEMIGKFYSEYGNFNSINNYLNYIYFQILQFGKAVLNEIYEVSEGLNNKIYENALKHESIDDFIMSLKSKRYTYSKIRRILLNILLNLKKNDIKNFMLPNNYIKVLAFNNIGRQILKISQNNGTIAVNKYSDYKKYCIDSELFDFTSKSTNIYHLPLGSKKINQEYYMNSVYVDI